MRWLVIACVTLLVACGGAQKTKQGKPMPAGVQEGYATWYGGELQGSATASGERFNKNAFTAAHRTLPLQTRVRVTNKRNGKSVVVRINDRGPFGNKSRIIDLSEAAARVIGIIDAGVAPVRLEVVH
jgi:rare lipoprotein A